MKKILIALIILSLSIQMLTFSVYSISNEVPYKDASPWAMADLNEAAENGLITERIMNKMNAPITREEFAELAVRLYENSTGKKASYGASDTFNDTKNIEIHKAFNLEIVNGTDMKLKLFSPNINTNREQVAAMLYRTIKVIKPDENMSVVGASSFSDEKEVSAWALDSLKYMSKQGYLLGSGGKINPKGLCTREMAVIIANRIYNKYAKTDTSSVQQEYKATSSQDISITDKTILTINDFTIASENYRIREKDNTHYIFVADDKFIYGFKAPYAGVYTYPDFTLSNGLINITWKNKQGTPILRIDMAVGSTEAQINGMIVDIGMAPYIEGEKTFIPINLLVAGLEIDIAKESTNKYLLLQYKEDFPKELLVGTWSSLNTDLFTGYEDITTGLVHLSSFATSYIFKEDGTYRLRMVSVGGFKDKFLELYGKYEIIGNTIMCYDIMETLYEGKPFMLVHKDKPLENFHFDFIEDYDPEKDKIEIGSSWLNRIN